MSATRCGGLINTVDSEVTAESPPTLPTRIDYASATRGALRHENAKIAFAVLFTAVTDMWRSGDLITTPQLFGKDGRVSFSEARTFGPRSISVFYAGPIHLVPRVVALACLPFSATRPPDGPFAISAPPLATLRLWTGRHGVHSRVVGLIVFSAAMLQLSFAIQIASPHEGISNPRHLVGVMIDRWIGRSAQCGLTLRSLACRADVVFFSIFAFALTTSEVLALKMLAYVSAPMTTTFALFIDDNRYFDHTSLGDRRFDVPRPMIMW